MGFGAINVDLNPGGILKAIFDGIDSLITSDEEKQQLKDAAANAAREGALREWAIAAGLLQGQIEVNKVEAASGKFWNGGWRPGVGWAGVSALFFGTTVPFALQTAFWALEVVQTGKFSPPPPMDLELVLLLLGQILGIGSLRSFDKLKGTSS